MNDSEMPAPLEFLIFELGERRFGVPVPDVREIVRAVPPVLLPGAPAIVEGVINVRGNVVPVFDLCRYFRLPARPVEPTDHMVIARVAGRLVALRVDRAQELVRVAAGDVQNVAGVGPSAQRIAKLPGDLVLIQDLAAVLSGAEAAALDAALPPHQGGPP